MYELDPRSYDDPREQDGDRDLSRGSRGSSESREREDRDPRDVFMSQVDLPRGLERVHVHDHGHDYTLRGSETRTLTTVGAFRVVPAADLRNGQDKPLEPGRGDLEHLRKSGLVQTIPTGGRDKALVLLTERGRSLLEGRRRETSDARQEFYAGLRKPKELTHDAQVYRAYLRAAERLRESGASIRRVVLDYELKSDYQRFLQERNRGKSDSDGRPDRTPEEIHAWALAHDLPHDDGHVQFPDARIEYEDVDARLRTEDIEVTTLHYRGGHAAAKACSGFSRYRAVSVRISAGRSGGGSARGSRGRGGRGFDPRIAEELLG